MNTTTILWTIDGETYRVTATETKVQKVSYEFGGSVDLFKFERLICAQDEDLFWAAVDASFAASYAVAA